MLDRRGVQAGNVAYLKGDWTNQNPEITRLLERHERSGVPLYRNDRDGDEARVLPQILTKAIRARRDRHVGGVMRPLRRP